MNFQYIKIAYPLHKSIEKMEIHPHIPEDIRESVDTYNNTLNITLGDSKKHPPTIWSLTRDHHIYYIPKYTDTPV
jgi:hypothetical protein